MAGASKFVLTYWLCLNAQEQSVLEGGWGSLLKRRYRRIMILAAALPILQQASGINTVVFYSSDVSAPCVQIFDVNADCFCGKPLWLKYASKWLEAAA